MRCDEIQTLIEALAETDGTLTPEVAEHLRGCERCAASLALARRIHGALEAMAAPQPPAGFTSAVIRGAHSIRWASEQRFDWWFNAVIAAALVLIGAGAWGLMDLTGIAAILVGTAHFIGASVPPLYDRVRPVVPLYLTATALVISALAVWWWLERGPITADRRTRAS